MAGGRIPQDVLVQRLADAVCGRRVRAAVFTTYTFDPGFFESHVLPALFDKPFSQVEKVRMVQMEEALRYIEDIAVYYDRAALSQDAMPAQLDYRRIDVRKKTGAFHPKLVLLLVENTDDEGTADLSLIVGVLSANLTRAGWWENVETGHFEEVWDKNYHDSRTSIRKDLQSLITRLKNCCAADEDHAALDRIRIFLRSRANRNDFNYVSFRGEYKTRLFCGQEDLPAWLEQFRLDRQDVNLEIISPYFDATPARTLGRFLESVQPARTLVYLPREVDGTAAVTRETWEAIGSLQKVRWADLPGDILRPGGRKNIENAPPRRVHAKVYRFWSKGGLDLTITGSVNLTGAGHSHSRAGNFEAAYLCDIGSEGLCGGPWLMPLDKEPCRFDVRPPEETDESLEIPVDVTFEYDWGAGTLRCRAGGAKAGPLAVHEPGGPRLFLLQPTRSGHWTQCDREAAEKVAALLPSTSFLEVRSNDARWRVLVREEGMSHRPSILLKLTPEEILMYWSLLSPDQQEYFLVEKLAREGMLPGEMIGHSKRYNTAETVFDRFAGIYHAFERLVDHVVTAIGNGEDREATSRLFGAKYDSLPHLLEKVAGRMDGDAVMGYVTFLSARQAWDRVRAACPEFIRAHRADARVLDARLAHLPAIRKHITVAGGDAFLDWYEEMFLKRIAQPPSGEEMG